MSRSAIDARIVQWIEDASPAALFTDIRIAEAGPELTDKTVADLLTARERLGDNGRSAY